MEGVGRDPGSGELVLRGAWLRSSLAVTSGTA